MNKKRKIILVSVGIMLVLSILIGISYAYYVFSTSQEDRNVFRSDCFKITFTDENDISLLNTIPMSDKDAKELTPYTFTITNVCNASLDYKINIETLNNSTVDLNAIKYKLDNRFPNVLGTIENNDAATIVNENVASSKTIFNGSLMGGQDRTFDLRLYVGEEATVEQSASKHYESKVVVSTSLNPAYKEATLTAGASFSLKLKKLANPSVTDNSTYDTTILGFERSATPAPSGVTTAVISESESLYPIYAWLDSDTNIIYYYTEATKIFYNRNSNSMFYRLKAIQNIDVSDLDASKVEYAQTMFALNENLETLNLGNNFDTSSCLNMTYMFYNDVKLTALDLGDKFDTSNVIQMKSTFNNLKSITSLDLGDKFDTSNVTVMESTFNSLSNATTLLLGDHFDTSKVTTMKGLFASCNKLTALDLGDKFDTSNVTDMHSTFNSLNKIPELNLGDKFYTSKVTDMGSTFLGLTSLSTLDLGDHFDTSSVTDMSYMFRYYAGSDLVLKGNWDTSHVTNMAYMFAGNYRVKSLDLGSFDTSNVTDMTNMFSNMNLLETVYVSNKWTTANVTSGDSMFNGDTKIKGSKGTVYNGAHTDVSYAHIDEVGNPGYFTALPEIDTR